MVKVMKQKRFGLIVLPLSLIGAMAILILWIGILTAIHKEPTQSALAANGTGVITHTLTSDFTQACAVVIGGSPTNPVFNNTTATTTGNGEVRMIPTLEDYFNGPTVNTSLWITGNVYDWYTEPVVITNGNLRLDSSYVRSIQPFQQTRRFFETRALVSSGVFTAANVDLGYYRLYPPLYYTGTIPDTEAIRIFVGANMGANNLYARARNGGSSVPLYDSDITPDPNLNQYHLFRIEWDTTQTRFYIDDVLRTTIDLAASSLPGYAFLYHQDPSESSNVGVMLVDWVRAGVYPTSGTYTSCALDFGTSVIFRGLNASTTVPTGSGLTIETRSNNGSGWSDWSTVTGETINSPEGRYLQYRLNFISSYQIASAEVQQLLFNYEINLPPTADAGGPYSGNEGSSISLSGSGSDPNGGPVTFAWDLDNNGSYETPGQNVSRTWNDNGTYIVGLRVSDSSGLYTTDTAVVNVANVAPTISNVSGATPINEGDDTTVTVTATDPAGVNDPLSYYFDCRNDGSYEIGPQSSNQATCSYEDNGSYTVRVRVTDGDGGEDTDTSFVVTVNNVPPTINNVSGTTPINEGGSTTVTVTATDPAGVNDPLSYSFDCRNDGSYEIGPQSSNQATCSYEDNGSYTVRVRVTDGDGGVDTDTSFVVTVNNVAPTISNVTGVTSINEGGSTTVTVTATDPAGVNDPLSYYFDCRNDGTYEIGPQSSSQATCSYEDNGTFTVGVRVTDGDGGEDTDTSFVVTVNNVPPTINNVSGATPINEGGSTTVTVTATDPAGVNDPLSYYFDCRNDGTYEIGPQSSSQATCSYEDNGTFTVGVRVTDGDGGEDTDTSFVVTVNNVAPTISNVTGVTSINEGGSTTVTVTATDPAGVNDPLSYYFDCRNDGTYEIGPQSSSQATCSYEDNGTFTVGVRVTDGDGGEDTDTSFVVTVNNVPPNVSVINNGPIAPIQPAIITVTAIDVDDDPLTYEFDCDDDGSYEIGPQSENIAQCSFSEEGSYTVNVRVSDDDGGVTLDSTIVVVRWIKLYLPIILKQ